jgi:Laminin G domain
MCAGDFFVVELINGGQLRMAADDGGGIRSVVSRSPSLSDGAWHSIDIVQTGAKTFAMRVDRKFSDVLTMVTSRNTLDLTGQLYVGGVPTSMRARLSDGVFSKSTAFSGCMASMVVNGRLFDLLNDVSYVSSSVTRGCTSKSVHVHCE